MGIMRVKPREELYNADSANEVIDASPCSVYFGASPRRTTGPTRSSTRGGWTEEELAFAEACQLCDYNDFDGQDYLLAESVRKFNGKHWKKIAEELINFVSCTAECLPGRTVSQCFCRWDRVLNPAIVKGTWTKEEDDCIMELVRNHGCRKWSVIAKSLPGRVGKQCRERWFNHLDPAIKRASWTEEEEMTLTYYHEIYGNKWAKIMRFLPGRSDNAIKNYWNGVLKKKLDSYSPNGCAMDLFTVSSPNSYNCATEIDCLKLEERQSLENADSEYENMGLRYSAEMSTSGSGKANGTEKKNEVCKLHMQPEETSQNCSHHNLQQLNNLVSNLDAGEFPSVDTSVVHPNSPFCCSTPTKFSGSTSANNNSPESILRNSARTFKNTPSIIRKRTFRNAAVAESSNVTCKPSLKIPCMNDHEPVNQIISLDEKQGFLPCIYKPESSFAVKSLKRYFDYAFDMEKDAASGKCGKPVQNSDLTAMKANLEKHHRIRSVVEEEAEYCNQ
ncbi:unnamed protein product [Dovyalis caffra]|uniref:Uncharacterized protein n=1 Tax=Dovyalis caffra TaxID=77055 RepID=A0AAV1RFU5_9ROSI|nr:unnamed protein product [Dovyalis caffra]